MAIIKPSKKFVGSEIDLRDAGKYIRSDVRQVTFSKRNNPNGAYLYFLPPYKVDSNGDGVWYKTIKIRDNFGDKFKEKYVVIDNDPVAYFERNLKVRYPEMAAIRDTTDDKGQARKAYPLCGRVTNRVIYNVAYLNNLEAGAHVLDLPLFNGASIIDAWLKEKDTKGRERPVLCDPENCIPVFIKLRDGGGAPWQIEPSQAEASVIPTELADSENIYNLDNIFVEKSAQELIGKLREMYSSDVFETCMEGYPGFRSNTDISQPVKQTVPTGKIAGVSKAVSAVSNIAKLPVVQDETEKEYIDDDIDMSPVTQTVELEKAQAFLKRPKPRVGG